MLFTGRIGGFSRKEANALDCDLLVADDTSMVDLNGAGEHLPATRSARAQPEPREQGEDGAR